MSIGSVASASGVSARLLQALEHAGLLDDRLHIVLAHRRAGRIEPRPLLGGFLRRPTPDRG